MGESILVSIGNFATIFIGSVLIGALSALLVAFVLKRQAKNSQDMKNEMQTESKDLWAYHQKQNINA